LPGTQANIVIPAGFEPESSRAVVLHKQFWIPAGSMPE
jgi:hypothetical protein